MITNVDQMKNTCRSSGAQTVTLIHSSTLWRQCRRVFSHANGQMSSCNILSQVSCTHCHNSAMVVAGSGERVSSHFIISHTCSIGKRSGVLAGQGSCTQRRACCVTAICGRALFCWKSTSPSCRRNGSSTRLTTCAM